MVNLDSIKIGFSKRLVSQFNHDYFKNNIETTNEGVVLRDKLICRVDKSVIGLKQIEFDKLSQKGSIELSAKYLGRDYPKGININTISQVVDKLNKSGIIQFDKNSFIERSELLRCDVTDNIKPTNSNLVFSTLGSFPIPAKYSKVVYNEPTNKGVTWKGNQKTVRDRIIFYDKMLDIQKDKFLKGNPYFLNEFSGVVRVESNLSDFETLRKYFGSRYLIDVLMSESKVNYNHFCKIVKESEKIDLSLFNHFEGMKFSQIRNLIGDIGIIKMNNENWTNVEAFVKRYCPNNYKGKDGYLNQIRRVFQDFDKLVRPKIKGRPKIDKSDVINEIKQLLKQAA